MYVERVTHCFLTCGIQARNSKCLPYNAIQRFIIFSIEPKMEHTDQILIMMVSFQMKNFHYNFGFSLASCSDKQWKRA